MTDAAKAEQLHSDAMKLASGGRIEESVPLLRQAVALDPQNPVFLHNCGHALQLLGQVQEAGICFARALAIEPEYGDAHYNLGNLHRTVGNYGDAVAHLSRAVDLSPQNHRAHHGLGSALMEQRRFIDAARSFERALALKPNYVEALISLGTLRAETGQPEAALSAARDADRIVGANPTPQVSYYVGALLARVGLADRARTHLKAYLQTDPNDMLGAGMILGSLGQATPDRAPRGLLDGIYGKRATLWEEGSGQAENYQGDILVADAVRALVAGKTGLAILDAGCGTGLVGARLAPIAGTLVGVDISRAMLAKAESKKIYAELYNDDLSTYMAAHPAAFDVIASAAALIHLGDLAPAFTAAATALRKGGVFVLTLFPNDQDKRPYIVHPTPGLAEGGCFAHHRDYVKSVAKAAGLSVVSIADATHEFHDSRPVPGIVVSLRR